MVVMVIMKVVVVMVVNNHSCFVSNILWSLTDIFSNSCLR